MTVREWLQTNRRRLVEAGEDWVARRVAVLEVPGRTLTFEFELKSSGAADPLFMESQEPVLGSCVVEIGSDQGGRVLHRVLEDPPAHEFEARRLIA